MTTTSSVPWGSILLGLGALVVAGAVGHSLLQSEETPPAPPTPTPPRPTGTTPPAPPQDTTADLPEGDSRYLRTELLPEAVGMRVRGLCASDQRRTDAEVQNERERLMSAARTGVAHLRGQTDAFLLDLLHTEEQSIRTDRQLLWQCTTARLPPIRIDIAIRYATAIRAELARRNVQAPPIPTD